MRGEVLWLHQVLAHLVARTAFENYEAGRLPKIDGFFDSLSAKVPERLALDQYAPGLDLDSYLWFESRFHEGARLVMQSTKKNEAKVLLKEAKKSSLAVSEEAFLESFPDMRTWLAESFAPSRVQAE